MVMTAAQQRINKVTPMPSVKRRELILGALAAGAAAVPLAASARSSVVPTLAIRNSFRQTNLAASKAAYGAAFTFDDMVDAWGIAIRPAGVGGHFWVTAGGKSYEFVGDVSASATASLRTLYQDGLKEVTVPNADALTTAASLGKSTGTAYNGAPINSNLFRVSQQTATRATGEAVPFDGSARFVFVTDSGALTAWTDRATDGSTVRIDGPAQLMFDGSAQGMSFFGVAVKTDTWDTLWTVDFGVDPQIRQFNANWQLVPTQGFANPFATGSLRDVNNADGGNRARPGDPVPFNIHVINGRVFVMYCFSQVLRNDAGFIVSAGQFFASTEDALDAAAEDKAGGFPDRGRLVEYTLTGDLVRIYDDLGRLNAPWGVAIAPVNFGLLSNMLLVGNFGGLGKIAAFNQSTGRFIDFVRDPGGEVVAISGLWGLMFGNGVSLGDTNALYFAAGVEDETGGLFGSLRYGL